MGNVRLLLIDPHTMFRNMAALLLDAQPGLEVVGQTGGSCKGLELAVRRTPDIVVLDLVAPRVGGRELAVLLTEHRPRPKLVGLSDLADPATLSRAMDCGLAGYVEKSQPLDVLVDAITAVANGEQFFTPTFWKQEALFAGDPNAFTKILSAREQEVLGLVGQGLTSRRIGEKLALSVRTVETHRHNIMKKMGFKDLATLVRYAVDGGFTYANCSSPFGTCSACGKSP